MSRYKMRKNGSSILQVLIMMGIMGIAFFAALSMIYNQQNSVRAVSQKLGSNDIDTLLEQVMSVDQFCDCLFRGKTFDTTKTTDPWSAPITSIPIAWDQPIPAAPAPCTPTRLIVPPVGQKDYQTNLETKSISTTEVTQIRDDLYNAFITVNYATLRSQKPAQVPIIISIDQTSGSPTARPFLSCGSEKKMITGQKAGRGRQLACGANVCCTIILFNTPLRTNQYSVRVTPFFQDYGSFSGDITVGYQNKSTLGFTACFDHIGKTIDNNFDFDWIATVNNDYP